MKTKIYDMTGTDPWFNLAAEEWMVRRTAPGEAVLYLWQNASTVVIGRHQNPWRECRTELLEAEGGKLARRMSGGGAVFHDLGNLNFSFIFPSEDYDTARQSETVLRALRILGIEGEKNGRNDLTIAGRKFSGSAFYKGKETSLHHGTLLVAADFARMSRYLSPSRRKLEAKGVESVRSRVMNLSELSSRATIPALRKSMQEAFFEEYGPGGVANAFSPEELSEIEKLEKKYASWAWRYGHTPDCSIRMETRFSWGELQMGFSLSDGMVKEAEVFSDALDEGFIDLLKGSLSGLPFRREELCAAAAACGDTEERRRMAEETAEWLKQEI